MEIRQTEIVDQCLHSQPKCGMYMVLRNWVRYSETKRTTRYVLCSYVYAHARPTGARFAREERTQPNVRAPARARSLQRQPRGFHPRDGALALHRLGPSRAVRPSAASLLLWLRKCGNTQATVHLNSIQVENREDPRNLHMPRTIYLLCSSLSLT